MARPPPASCIGAVAIENAAIEARAATAAKAHESLHRIDPESSLDRIRIVAQSKQNYSGLLLGRLQVDSGTIQNVLGKFWIVFRSIEAVQLGTKIDPQVTPKASNTSNTE